MFYSCLNYIDNEQSDLKIMIVEMAYEKTYKSVLIDFFKKPELGD